ncbi:hypothetical protein Bca101_067274 [Brassica carinata]
MGEVDASEGNDSHPIDDPVDAGLPSPQPARERAQKKAEKNEAPQPEEPAPEGGSIPGGGSSGSSKKGKKKGKRSRGKPDGAASEEHSRKKAKSGKTNEAQQSPGLGSNLADVQEPLREEDVAEDRGQPADASFETVQGQTKCLVEREASPTKGARIGPPGVSCGEGHWGRDRGATRGARGTASTEELASMQLPLTSGGVREDAAAVGAQDPSVSGEALV